MIKHYKMACPKQGSGAQFWIKIEGTPEEVGKLPEQLVDTVCWSCGDKHTAEPATAEEYAEAGMDDDEMADGEDGWNVEDDEGHDPIPSALPEPAQPRLDGAPF